MDLRDRLLGHDSWTTARFLDRWTESPTRRTYGATIIQVILHNAQHRSEALHILTRLGLTDLPESDPQE